MDAIIIVTAKVAGPDDTLHLYQEHLMQRAESLGSDALLKPPRLLEIEGVIWVDATLRESEIPSYTTRYLATVENDIAVLFTFAAHRTVYERLIPAALQAVHTLELREY